MENTSNLVASSTTVSAHSGIRISVVGRSQKQYHSMILQSILRRPKPFSVPSINGSAYIEEVYHHDVLPESIAVALSEYQSKPQPYSDACFMFLDDKLLLEEDIVLGRYLDSFQALLHNRTTDPALNETGNMSPPLSILLSSPFVGIIYFSTTTISIYFVQWSLL